MKLTVTNTPVRLPVEGGGTPVVQNIGPGDVYMDSGSVDVATGLLLPAGATYEFGRDLSLGSGNLWLVSIGTADVRYMVVG